ncbi:MAG: radical protein [Planctomycetaceae bacterium]|nr:radical protein [Planctomycetaceae bacterium]
MPIRRRIILLQLPIPQPGLEPAKGNVPLAAGYLKMYARNRGLEEFYDIEIFPPHLANTLSDHGLVEAIQAQEPWMVGFTCYLWNINRSLWVADHLKAANPELFTVFGGPEITADNGWVLQSAALDFASIGEGEQTFSELLKALTTAPLPAAGIAGLYVAPAALRTIAAMSSVVPSAPTVTDDERLAAVQSLPIVENQLPAVPASKVGTLPLFRTPLPNLNAISSPYLEGILDAADEGMLLLETIRGCIFKCKFCYYPKSYDDLYFVSRDKIVANLQHAREHGATEVVLLDPTLNQRKDFAEFLQLLAECNPGRRFAYFGELRSEGINDEIAALLAAANFTEVEIGLQSVDPVAQELMDRKNNMKAFERGVKAMREAGIRVKVDLIIGLPGDTVASIRRGMKYLRDSGLYDLVQVFNLAILPGTAFRQEAEQLGLKFQPVPPYYVLKTPTLEMTDFYELMAEAQEIFETEFDPLPEPVIPEVDDCGLLADGPDGQSLCKTWRMDFDRSAELDLVLPAPGQRTQAFTLWFQGHSLPQHQSDVMETIATCLLDNPHSTLQIILEPRAATVEVTPEFLDDLLQVCFRTTSYLDRFYSMAPGRRKGAKRLVLLLSWSVRDVLGTEWIDSRGEYADIVWRDAEDADAEMAEFEYVLGAE